MTLDISWLNAPTKSLSKESICAGKKRQAQLTKPEGSLGLLESVAIRFCGFQGREFPKVDNVVIRVFAADHGVCAQGVSAFPQIVTTQMIANFCVGGAAISVLSRHLNADFAVVNLGTVHFVPKLSSANQSLLLNKVIAAGTQDFTQGMAMTRSELEQALSVGRSILDEASKSQVVELFIGGEMGIGNTTSASAIYSILLDLIPELTVGPGTGVDSKGVQTKISVIKQSLALHKEHLNSPLDILQCVGGFEIAALTGCYIACAQKGIPVLVDGFICTAAALLAAHINPESKSWFLFSHQSAEPAHVLALEYFDAQPLLDLGMRLGEASGAAVAVPILKSAIHLHNEMATFNDALVSDAAL
jgi:nicotinate-nucleotide--dimethylbenzimidazole phosphoribosyltransferase